MNCPFWKKHNKVNSIPDWFNTDVAPPIGTEVQALVLGHGIRKLRYVSDDNDKEHARHAYFGSTNAGFQWKDEAHGQYFHKNLIEGWRYIENKKSVTIKV